MLPAVSSSAVLVLPAVSSSAEEPPTRKTPPSFFVFVCLRLSVCESVFVTFESGRERREGGRRRKKDSETYVESTRLHLSSSKCNHFLIRDPALLIRVGYSSQKEGGENHRECVPCAF